MSRLSLSIDEEVVARAKRLAEEQGTSVSKLVERYLQRLTTATESRTEPPVLSRLRGKDGAGHWHLGNLSNDGAGTKIPSSNATMPVSGTICSANATMPVSGTICSGTICSLRLVWRSER